MNDLLRALRDAVTPAIARTDTAWALNRPKAMDRTRAAVMAAIEPIVSAALDEAYDAGVRDGRREEIAHHDMRADQIRTTALLEAAVKLKRHGHRSAVQRLQEMATETPTRPRQATTSPAGGPGKCPNDPDCTTCPDFTCALNDTGVAPEPTKPTNGAQRGVQDPRRALLEEPGLRQAYEAAHNPDLNIINKVINDRIRQQAHRRG